MVRCTPGRSFTSSTEASVTARGQKPRASYGKWAKPLTEGHGKTQCFRHFSVSLRPRSGDAAPACPGFLTRCGGEDMPPADHAGAPNGSPREHHAAPTARSF